MDHPNPRIRVRIAPIRVNGLIAHRIQPINALPLQRDWLAERVERMDQFEEWLREEMEEARMAQGIWGPADFDWEDMVPVDDSCE